MIIGLFFQKFQQILDDHISTKQISSRSHLPWMIVALIRKKQRVYNRARCYSRESDWLEYKSLKKDIDHKLKYQHKTYLTDMISSPDNKKPLWRYIKAKQQDHTGISTLKDPING